MKSMKIVAAVAYTFAVALTLLGCAVNANEPDKAYRKEVGMFEWTEETVLEPEKALELVG